jgi:hypothetical protein
MRTFVYVDGFNLYNLRLKKQRQFRWLNLKALSELLTTPPHVIERVNYYTACVSGRFVIFDEARWARHVLRSICLTSKEVPPALPGWQ